MSTWIKICDTMTEHPKIVEAGPYAGWLYLCGITYASRNLTDGFIPAALVRRLSDVPDPKAEAARLVEVGLWIKVDGGFQVHDYAEYQRTNAEVENIRAAATERQRRRRSKSDTPPAKKSVKDYDPASLKGVEAALVAAGGVLDEALAASKDPVGAYLEVLALTPELGPQAVTTSKDPVGYLANQVLARCAKDTHEVEGPSLSRLVKEAKLLGADGHAWVITALVNTASSKIEGDPVSYVIKVARNLAAEARGSKGRAS